MNSVDLAEAQNPAYAQLIQAPATIAEASELFASNDPAAPMPIVITPRYQNRLFNPMSALSVLAAVAAAVIAFWLDSRLVATGVGLLALLLALLSVLIAFRIVIPEGMHALLVHGGKFRRTIGAGYHVLPPWVVVSHLVTARAIPYAISVREAPTLDFVRADVDGTLTFAIEDPARFVFRTSTGAFDEILQASCQDALRATIRSRPAIDINDIAELGRGDIRRRVTADVESFGIAVTNVNITRARLPEAFVQSQEARQLAILRQAEQAEQQVLALRRQADSAALALEETVAEMERQRTILRGESLQAEARRKVAEMDAETNRRFPEAVQLHVTRMRLDVARALAANSRAIVRVGGIADFEQVIGLAGDRPGAASIGGSASPDSDMGQAAQGDSEIEASVHPGK